LARKISGNAGKMILAPQTQGQVSATGDTPCLGLPTRSLLRPIYVVMFATFLYLPSATSLLRAL